MLRLQGIIPPMVTPLTADERVDEQALVRQARRLVEGGVHGLYLLGSTGEQPALRSEERARAIRAARAAVGGRVPIVVGCMASSTARAIDNIQQAAECGADAVAVTPPHYYPSRGEGEQIAHYRACAAASPLPVVIYNIPQMTKVMLSAATIRQIAALPNVIGVKDSSTDFIHFLQLLTDLRDNPDFAVLMGAPLLAGAAVLYGADGAVPGIGNIDPGLMVSIWEAGRRRDVSALWALQARLQSLFQIVSFGAPIACLKTALERMGVCRACTTAPLPPVSPEGREAMAAILREHGLLAA